MFLSARTYKQAIEGLIRTEAKVDIAVAFWGKGAEALFPINVAPPRIICNLMTGASDPRVIDSLSKRFPGNVRHLSDLHSKIVISKERMIVGSANFSSSGLAANPDGTSGWEEAGAIVNDRGQIDSAQQWFEAVWGRASPVLPRDIEIAEVTWGRSRDERPVLSAARALLDMPIREFEDRRICVALWEEPPSDTAVDRFEAIKPNISSRLSTKGNGDIDFFQNSKFPEETVLIRAQVLPSGRVKVDGAWMRVPEFDERLKGRNAGSLQVIVKRKRVLDRLFDSSTRQELSRVIEGYIKSASEEEFRKFESGIPLFNILQSRTDG